MAATKNGKIILSTPFGGKQTNNPFAKPLRIASNTFCFDPDYRNMLQKSSCKIQQENIGMRHDACAIAYIIR